MPKNHKIHYFSVLSDMQTLQKELTDILDQTSGDVFLKVGRFADSP